jgi:hypothetical protein
MEETGNGQEQLITDHEPNEDDRNQKKDAKTQLKKRFHNVERYSPGLMGLARLRQNNHPSSASNW